MILLLPLSLATALARLGAKLLVRRGVGAARPWDSWSAALAAGVATVYVATGVTHFVEPQRSGLEAIVPSAIPWPGASCPLASPPSWRRAGPGSKRASGRRPRGRRRR